MYIKRKIVEVLDRYKSFPVIAILGPRQSGKTTLAKNEFKNHRFIDLDDPLVKDFALRDPWGFFRSIENEHGVIIDEFQNIPELTNYIKLISDEKKRPGYFVITGSQNYLMNQQISQSMAGRVGILTLLPLSISELKEAGLLTNYEDLIIKGFYPRIYSDNIPVPQFYSSYVQTYVEKDVRLLSNVINLTDFKRFLILCAGRAGQLLNISDLAVSTGVDQNTIKRWLSILEAGYIIFPLVPYYKNFNKRMTKSYKIYFYDVGLASYLLNIQNKEHFFASPFKGHLFENFIIADLFKQSFNMGKQPNLYFWRDTNDRIEVDCLFDKVSSIIPIEIKSSESITSSFFDNLESFNKISETESKNNFLVYAGNQNQLRKTGNVVSWDESGDLIDRLNKLSN